MRSVVLGGHQNCCIRRKAVDSSRYVTWRIRRAVSVELSRGNHRPIRADGYDVVPTSLEEKVRLTISINNMNLEGWRGYSPMGIMCRWIG